MKKDSKKMREKSKMDKKEDKKMAKKKEPNKKDCNY